jgi:hypothetical protein
MVVVLASISVPGLPDRVSMTVGGVFRRLPGVKDVAWAVMAMTMLTARPPITIMQRTLFVIIDKTSYSGHNLEKVFAG